MDDAIRDAVSRIVAENQKSRALSSDRARRLMDSLVSGEREEYTDTVNDIISESTKRDAEHPEEGS